MIGRRAELVGLAVGACAIIVSLIARPVELRSSLGQVWPPFVLVTGLLLIGFVANEEGLFTRAAGLLAALPVSPMIVYSASMALVAVVTVLLNLDTSVAFLTPVLIYLAGRRDLAPARFMYGCVFMSNAASLLLPGSNLTNLIVLAAEPENGAVFLAKSFLPWVVAVIATSILVWFLFGGDGKKGDDNDTQADDLSHFPIMSGSVIALAVILILVLPNAALPVLALGAAGWALLLWRRTGTEWRAVGRQIDFLGLLTIFCVAASLGTVARLWTGPHHLLESANPLVTTVVGAVASVLVNNLPAAVLLSSMPIPHPRALLIGLNIGPNLAVTGSLSALIWWQACRTAGEQPSALRYTYAGIVLVPVTLALALGATLLP